MPGLLIGAPHSGSGKTMITLGLLRYLRGRGLRVGGAKVGPDYVDGGFLAAASGFPCRNLDPWAMRPATLAAAIGELERDSDLVLAEGVMGLFDGAGVEGAGSSAELAALTGWPVILVVNLEGQAASAAALIEGFARHRQGVTIAGVIFNRVGSERHRAMAEAALRRTLPDMEIFGAVPRCRALALPSRHLGLVPAGEHREIDAFLDRAAALMGEHIEINRLCAVARPARASTSLAPVAVPPLGARISIAQDDAFAFTYWTVLESWRKAGASLTFFSPLRNEAPASDADAIYLPGGYPELFAATIAANRRFLDGLQHAARAGATIYGECGGYMVLGRALTDADGKAHGMAGLLPLETSFAARKLHLGYRVARLGEACALGEAGQRFRGHEFHYATVIAEDGNTPLFGTDDADGATLGPAGLLAGKVMGSFIHLIDRA